MEESKELIINHRTELERKFYPTEEQRLFIKARLMELGLNQRKLAEHLRISPLTLSRKLTGKNNNYLNEKEYLYLVNLFSMKAKYDCVLR
jgi:hypothetical protein